MVFYNKNNWPAYLFYEHLWMSVCRVSSFGAMFVLLNGCSVFGFGDGPEPYQIEALEIVTELDANHDSPTPIDLVEIYDSSLYLQVQTLSASQWFNQKAGLVASNPDVLAVTSWELPPGKRILDDRWLSMDRVPVSIILFVGHKSSSPNRIELRPRSGTFRLSIQADSFKLKTEGAG